MVTPARDQANGQNEPTALLCLYHHQQLLPGVVAVLHYRRIKKIAEDAPLLVMVWTPSFLSDEAYQTRQKEFEKLISAFPWARLWFVERELTATTLSHLQPVMKKASFLKNKFGSGVFQEFYFAHDISGDFMAQSVMQAFPNATHICFGDAFGLVYKNENFEQFTYPLSPRAPHVWFCNLLARLKRAAMLPAANKQKKAQIAILMIPCDPKNNFLAEKELMVPDRKLAIDVWKKILAATQIYDEKIIPLLDQRRRNFCFLMGSYAESKLMDCEQELQLYEAVVKKHIPENSHIILKSHPAANFEKVTQLAARLSPNYHVTTLDPAINVIPIEMLDCLIEKTEIISFSYSSVSLLYLTEKPVTHALDDAFIKAFFPPKSHKWMVENNSMLINLVGQITQQYFSQSSQKTS